MDRSLIGTAEKPRERSREIKKQLEAGVIIVLQETLKLKLVERDLGAHIASKNPRLRAAYFKNRLRRAQKYVHWTTSDWGGCFSLTGLRLSLKEEKHET